MELWNVLFIAPFYRGGDPGTERLSNLPIVAQVANGVWDLNRVCLAPESVLLLRTLWHLSRGSGRSRKAFGGRGIGCEAMGRGWLFGNRQGMHFSGSVGVLLNATASVTTLRWSVPFVRLSVAKCQAPSPLEKGQIKKIYCVLYWFKEKEGRGWKP